MKFDRIAFAAKHRADILKGEEKRRDREFDLMRRVVSAATDVVNDVEMDQFGNGMSPSLGLLATLADAVHAHWKFQRGDE